MDISNETKETLALYGVGADRTDNFGRQCLLARRFAEKGVRYIQCTHSYKWDQHENLKKGHSHNALEVDQPIAALLIDLKRRGLLKDTLVWWGAEFGRTPTAQGNRDGRDHNPHGFSMWLAGGGVKAGTSVGASDDFGYYAVDNKVHMHDMHATILHLIGSEPRTVDFPPRGPRLPADGRFGACRPRSDWIDGGSHGYTNPRIHRCSWPGGILSIRRRGCCS